MLWKVAPQDCGRMAVEKERKPLRSGKHDSRLYLASLIHYSLITLICMHSIHMVALMGATNSKGFPLTSKTLVNRREGASRRLIASSVNHEQL